MSRHASGHTPSTHLNVKGASAVHVVVELGDGSLGLLDSGELHHTDTLGAAALEEDLSLVNLAGSLEELYQVLVGSRPGQVLDEDLGRGLRRGKLGLLVVRARGGTVATAVSAATTKATAVATAAAKAATVAATAAEATASEAGGAVSAAKGRAGAGESVLSAGVGQMWKAER